MWENWNTTKIEYRKRAHFKTSQVNYRKENSFSFYRLHDNVIRNHKNTDTVMTIL